jgi:adenylyl cyclase-associated protein
MITHHRPVLQIPSLADLLHRLEAATSRLEDIASSSFDPAAAEATPIANGSAQTSRNGTSAFGAPSGFTPKIIETAPSNSVTPTPPSHIELPDVIKDYDQLIKGDLAKFISLSEALDPLLAEQAQAFKAAWGVQRQFLLVTTMAKQPPIDKLIKSLQDTQEAILNVEVVREKNRGSPWKDHLSMVADGASTLGWVTVEPKPFECVAELFGGAQMYGNKVLRHFKDKYVPSYHVAGATDMTGNLTRSNGSTHSTPSSNHWSLSSNSTISKL